MTKLERGTVISYDEMKGMGRIRVFATANKAASDLILHRNNGCNVQEGTLSPNFGPLYGTLANRNVPFKRISANTEIVLLRGAGTVVDRWMFADRYDQVVALMRQRPIYRVTKHTLDLEGSTTTSTVWEGRCIADLSLAFPKDKEIQTGRYIDSLRARSSRSDGSSWYFTYDYRTLTGTWKSCADPRMPTCCLPDDQDCKMLFRKHRVRRHRCNHTHQK